MLCRLPPASFAGSCRASSESRPVVRCGTMSSESGQLICSGGQSEGGLSSWRPSSVAVAARRLEGAAGAEGLRGASTAQAVGTRRLLQGAKAHERPVHMDNVMHSNDVGP